LHFYNFLDPPRTPPLQSCFIQDADRPEIKNPNPQHCFGGRGFAKIVFMKRYDIKISILLTRIVVSVQFQEL